MRNQKILNRIFIITSILLIVSFVNPDYVFAGFKFANTKSSAMGFGGRVTMKQSCTCSSGYQVTIQGPGQSSGTYLESPGSRSYKNYTISPGRYVLGTYTPGGQCLYYVGESCEELQISKGTIKSYGVSFGSGFNMAS